MREYNKAITQAVSIMLESDLKELESMKGNFHKALKSEIENQLGEKIEFNERDFQNSIIIVNEFFTHSEKNIKAVAERLKQIESMI